MRSLLIQKGVRHERQTQVNNVVVYRGKYWVFDDSDTSLYVWGLKRCQEPFLARWTVIWKNHVMGRAKRAAKSSLIYHVLNRANARMTIFEKDGDYESFERMLTQAVERYETRLLSYGVMPNHGHLVLWLRKDNEISKCTGWLTLTHT